MKRKKNQNSCHQPQRKKPRTVFNTRVTVFEKITPGHVVKIDPSHFPTYVSLEMLLEKACIVQTDDDKKKRSDNIIKEYKDALEDILSFRIYTENISHKILKSLFIGPNFVVVRTNNKSEASLLKSCLDIVKEKSVAIESWQQVSEKWIEHFPTMQNQE